MPNRSRDKQLAKQHAKRRADRERDARRRQGRNGLIGAAIAGVILIVGLVFLQNRGDLPEDQASGTPSASASAAPDGAPTKIGEVTAQATPPGRVACDGQVPDGWSQPKPQFDEAPAAKDVLDKGVDYVAVVETSCGTFEIDLLEDVAPQTVASFVFLSQQGFYDGVWFHRIVPDFVIQTGDPLGTGAGGPGYQFGLEVDPELNYDHIGQVAMARAQDPNSNGSQWFVTTGEASSLDQQYTIFGDVIEGLDVVKDIAAVPTGGASGDTPELAAYVDRVTIDER